MTQAQARLTDNMLDIIDSSPNGVPLLQIEAILRESIGFHDAFLAINLLWQLRLIWVDGNHVAHRVQS